MFRPAFEDSPSRRLALTASKEDRVTGRTAQSLLISVVLTTGAAAAQPTVTGSRLITGRGDTRFPVATNANLDAGDLVAGNTQWDNDGDGIFFVETRVGFLWSPAGGMRPFEESGDVYFDDNRQFVSDISDGGVVVGTDLFLNGFTAKAFAWSASGGLQFLPLPGLRFTGSAAAVSADGLVVVGAIRPGFTSTDPSRASRWIAKSPRARYHLQQLPTPDLWSNAWDTSANGGVTVGDRGPAEGQLAAARWINGSLATLQPVGDTSTARFASSDGATAIGWADVSGRRVLVRWGGDGSASVFEPPGGMTLDSISAVNPSASAVAGSVSSAGNLAPFVWTQRDGFVVLPELGFESYYDRSVAYDVSDDGSVVVGTLQASIQGPGDPGPVGFVWVREEGLFSVNDLFTASGLDPWSVFDVRSVSGDGTRFLAAGNPPRTASDTNSLIVTIARP